MQLVGLLYIETASMTTRYSRTTGNTTYICSQTIISQIAYSICLHYNLFLAAVSDSVQ